MKALVTGVTRGIGRSLVGHLVAAGWDVVGVGRDRKALELLAGELGPSFAPAEADVTDARALAALDLSGLDLVVANAGALLGAGPLADTDAEDWWRGFEVNVRGAYLTMRAVLPSMIRRGSGRIVVLSSGMATEPSPWNTSYGASKAAVLHLASSVQAELEGTGVTVFPVSPGMVRTDMTVFPEELTRHVPDLAGIPDDRFTPVERFLGLVDRIASGELDALAGRFLHARDDLDLLLSAIAPGDPRARLLRLAPGHEGDPRS